MVSHVHVATLQPALRWQQPMPNMFAMRRMIEELPSGVELVVLPEMWTALPVGSQANVGADSATQFVQTLARAAGVNVIGGSFEARGSDGALQNVTVGVDARGVVVGRYAKQVLFAAERDGRQPGAGSAIFEFDGLRVGVLICADLWHPGLVKAIADADVLCVPARTAVPSDQHVLYARVLWHSLALTRAMEFGLPVVVSDWATGRHAATDVDLSVGSVHAPGMSYDRGTLGSRRSGGQGATGPREATATAHTSAAPALGPGVHFTGGASSICNPGRRPDIQRIWRTLDRGQAGFLSDVLDLADVQEYREYRRRVGLLASDPRGEPKPSGNVAQD